MSDTKYLLLILNCKKYRYKAKAQQKTWLKLLPSKIQYYHVVGDEDMDTQYRVDDEEHVLYLRCKDDYNSLPMKTYLAVKAATEFSNCEYIFKTDDDQALVARNLFTSIIDTIEEREGGSRSVHYGGQRIFVPDHVSTYYTVHPCLPKDVYLKSTVYCNGRFYILSREAACCILTKRSLFEKAYIEDHCVGLALDERYKNADHFLPVHSDKVFCDISFASNSMSS